MTTSDPEEFSRRYRCRSALTPDGISAPLPSAAPIACIRCSDRTSPSRVTKAEREERKDPRPSIAERYATRDAYVARIKESASVLVKDGFLLNEDVSAAVARAAAHWDLIMGATNASSR